MLSLRSYNVWTQVLSHEGKELDWLRAKLTVEYKARGGKAKEELVHPHAKPYPLAPSGWLRTILAYARRDGIQVQVDDQRKKPCAPDWGADIAWLYPWQQEALRKLVDAEQGILKAETSSGKGSLIVALTKVLPCTWIVLIQDKSLLMQFKERFWSQGHETVGLIGDNHWSVARVTVAMVQSLVNKLDHPDVKKFLLSRQALAADECHGAGSLSMTKVLRALHSAYWRTGFSATPTGRSDARDMAVVSHIGRIVHVIGAQELEAEGKIAETEILFHRCLQTNIPPYNMGGYERAISHSRIRNQLVANLWQTCEKPCLTYVRELSHGRYLLQIAQQMGLRALFVEGASNQEERITAIGRLERHELDILIGSDALKQGVDIVHVRSEVMAAGGKAIIPTVQRKGRGGRVCHEGLKGNCAVCRQYGLKTKLTLHDVYDVDTAKTGKKQKDRGWAENHSLARMKALRDRGYEPKIC